MNIRDKIYGLMNDTINGKSDKEINLIIDYTNKILSLIDNKDKTVDYTMFHTGFIPNCCKSCNKYKEGEVCICNCSLPALEQFSNIIGDNTNE